MDVGDCWDHFLATYFFPRDVLLDFSSSQFLKGFSDIQCRMYGSRGTVDTHYSGEMWIRGGARLEGTSKGLYDSGVVNNVRDFHMLVTNGTWTNTTVPPSVRSNLTCILGRDAAYKSDVLTWKDMLTSAAKIDGKLKGLKS